MTALVMDHSYLSDEVFEAVPRYLRISLLVRLGQVRLQDFHAHAEIRLVEIIRHIPADLAVFAPFLHDGMEECEGEDEG